MVEKMKVLSEFYFAIVMDRAFKVSSIRVKVSTFSTDHLQPFAHK